MATTFEENEEIRKAEEDKLYGENPESKTIQAQREALAKEEAERASFLEETRDKRSYNAGEDPEDGKRERTVKVPALDDNGQIEILPDGSYNFWPVTITDPPQTLNSLMVGPFTAEEFYNNFVRQDNRMTWPAEGTLLDSNSSTGDILDYIKEYGAFKIGKHASADPGPSESDYNSTTDSLIFDPVWMAQGELPAWRDLLDTLTAEIETGIRNRDLQEIELAQLTESEDAALEALQQAEQDIALNEVYKTNLQAVIADLELEVEGARNARDTFTVGTPEWNAANAVFLGKQAELAEQQALLAGVEATLVQRKTERDELQIDLNTIEARLAYLEPLLRVNSISVINMRNAIDELEKSIAIADAWQKEILNAYPKIEQEYKLNKEVIKKLEDREEGIQNDLKTLAKKESNIRLGIHNAQGAAAVGVAEEKVGDLGSLNAAGQPISPTGAIGAAFKKSQDVAAQLNKPVYTAEELKEIARQNASADELHKYRARRTDKGKMGFSGCDITAVLRVPGYSRGKTSLSENLIFQLGTLQTIAISTYNSKTPVKSIGFKNPIAVARGGRTIAGTMIFNQLHRHVFDDNAYGEVVNDESGFLTYSQGDTQYFISSQEIRDQNTDPYAAAIADAEAKQKAKTSAVASQVEIKNKVERFKPGTTKESFKPKQYDYFSFEPKKFQVVEGPWRPADDTYLAELKERQKSWENNKTKGYLSDEDIKNKSYINRKKLKKQWDFSWDTSLVGERVKPSDLPPFDIIIMLVNEMGNLGKIILYGVEIIHDSQTLSVEDIYTEAQYQYIAKDIEYFHADDFGETKAWVSNMPKYGYKGFYLANIERAQAELSKLKTGIAQNAWDLAAELKGVAGGIAAGIALQKKVKEITLDKLKAELAELEKELGRFSTSDNPLGLDAIKKLISDTEELLAAKEAEIKAFHDPGPVREWDEYRIQDAKIKQISEELKKENFYQTDIAVVLPREAILKTDEEHYDWEEYFASMNEWFWDDLTSPDPNSTFWPTGGGTRTTKAKLVYEYFEQERLKSEADLNTALTQFENGDGTIDGYVNFWNKIILRNYNPSPPADAPYPKRGVEAKAKLKEYKERFIKYYNFRRLQEAAIAKESNNLTKLQQIFTEVPTSAYSDIIHKMKTIIQDKIGPASWPQYSYFVYLDESKLDQANKDLAARGKPTWTLEELDKKLIRVNGKLTGSVERISGNDTVGTLMYDMLDWTIPEVIVGGPKFPYSTNQVSAIHGETILPSYRVMTTPGGAARVKWEEVPFRYEYIPVYSPPTKLSKRGEAFNAQVAKLNSEYSNVFNYLEKSYTWPTDAGPKPELIKYYPIFGENLERGEILEMKVTEFFKLMLDGEQSEISTSMGQYLRFKDQYFFKDYANYKKLLQDWDFERWLNNNEVVQRPASYTDLKVKASFYDWLLRSVLNNESSSVKDAKIKDILDKIKEKKRQIALVNSGQYNDATEEERTDLLQNTESGPTRYGDGSQAIPPMSKSITPTFKPATSVPAEPATTTPAAEQTQTVKPPTRI